MAASANPSESAGGVAVSGNPANGNSTAAPPDNSAPAQALKHNPGLAVEWTAEEQSILEERLAQYVSESSIVRYAKIALQLHEKTVRDVALRCRWMTKKESSKRRKDDHNISKKNNKKGVPDTSAKASHVAARPGVPSYLLPILPVDNDDEISYKAIGGATGELLEQNAQYINQISANLSSYQVQENINLFCQIRDNICSISKDIDETGVMKQMPSLAVKLNEELANSILPALTPGTSMPMQS